jgi:hypothetical protein
MKTTSNSISIIKIARLHHNYELPLLHTLELHSSDHQSTISHLELSKPLPEMSTFQAIRAPAAPHAAPVLFVLLPPNARKLHANLLFLPERPAHRFRHSDRFLRCSNESTAFH